VCGAQTHPPLTPPSFKARLAGWLAGWLCLFNENTMIGGESSDKGWRSLVPRRHVPTTSFRMRERQTIIIVALFGGLLDVGFILGKRCV
jgi:hypothetical protein